MQQQKNSSPAAVKSGGTALQNRRFGLRPSFFVFPCSIFFMELVVKYCTTTPFFNLGLVFVPLFSAVFGTLLCVLCTSFSKKVNSITAKIVLLLLSVLFSVQTVYHWVFDKYLILYSVGAGGTGQIIEDGIIKNTVNAIKACAVPVLLLFLPSAAGLIFIGKKIKFEKINWKKRAVCGISSFALQFVSIMLVLIIPSSGEVYRQAFDPNLTVGTLGLISTEIMDFQYNVLGLGGHSKINSGAAMANTHEKKSDDPWVMNFDFNSLAENEDNKTVKSLHKYFAGRTPTNKNEYTGKYSGYNLIYITAEGFSPYAISKELTPTLYKMYNNGYRFNNFYTPIWGVSTSDGEYVNCTGLIPKSGVWSFYRSGIQKNNMKFTMGRQFLNSGTDAVYAYHPHTYTYYHRDISHPNMGYVYKGYGNGLENKITKSWPESDYELIAATADDYITSQKPFHAYYMTVSGHMEYTFSGNAMARKNMEKVKDLDCSEAVKAYYACNIELDKAMELLLKKLEAASVADKTLIVIVPDHYPYGLEDKESDDKYHYFSEMMGHSPEINFELYKSVMLMYTPAMTQSVEVDKYCSSLDILPTLSNLFGFEYDSRLLMGKDIFSSSEPLVVFSNRSFITKNGRYNSVTKTFEPFEGSNITDTEEYVSKMKREVNNMFVASADILDTDYYGILFGTKQKQKQK